MCQEFLAALTELKTKTTNDMVARGKHFFQNNFPSAKSGRKNNNYVILLTGSSEKI